MTSCASRALAFIALARHPRALRAATSSPSGDCLASSRALASTSTPGVFWSSSASLLTRRSASLGRVQDRKQLAIFYAQIVTVKCPRSRSPFSSAHCFRSPSGDSAFSLEPSALTSHSVEAPLSACRIVTACAHPPGAHLHAASRTTAFTSPWSGRLSPFRHGPKDHEQLTSVNVFVNIRGLTLRGSPQAASHTTAPTSPGTRRSTSSARAQ